MARLILGSVLVAMGLQMVLGNLVVAAQGDAGWTNGLLAFLGAVICWRSTASLRRRTASHLAD